MSDIVKPLSIFTYCHRYPSFPPQGATVIRFGTGGNEINGSRPIEAIPLCSYDEAAAEITRLRADREAVIRECCDKLANPSEEMIEAVCQARCLIPEQWPDGFTDNDQLMQRMLAEKQLQAAAALVEQGDR